MSIATELTKLQARRDSIVTAINDKGGECASGASLNDCATAIANIPSGGGEDIYKDIIEGNVSGDIVLPNDLTAIRAYGFYYYTALTSITIPDSVISIGTYAFQYCTSLASVTIGSGITSISNYVFTRCTALTSITIPDSVISIGTYAFQYCTALTSITIPNSVRVINSGAFYGCSSLESITIPSSVSGIGDRVFMNCKNLTTMTVEAITPPAIQASMITSTIPSTISAIYVPADSIYSYKSNTNWNMLADKIQAIEE